MSLRHFALFFQTGLLWVTILTIQELVMFQTFLVFGSWYCLRIGNACQAGLLLLRRGFVLLTVNLCVHFTCLTSSDSDPRFGDQLCMFHCFDPQWVNLTVNQQICSSTWEFLRYVKCSLVAEFQRRRKEKVASTTSNAASALGFVKLNKQNVVLELTEVDTALIPNPIDNYLKMKILLFPKESHQGNKLFLRTGFMPSMNWLT